MKRETMARACALFFVALLASVQLAAQTKGLPADKVKKVEALISAEMAKQKIPGLSVAIVTDNQLTWSNGYGMADVENSVPANAATMYRLASISKPITATAAMQLVERGKIDMDAPVQKYCAAFPEKPQMITTRQLLSHQSGIRHYKSYEEFNSTRHYNSINEALDIFKNDPLLQEPGTKYTYTTFGYVLLGCVIEGASGVPYADYVRENILKPAGMTGMRVDEVAAIIPHRARGYGKTKAGELRNAELFDSSNKIPGGGWTSAVDDLAKFAIAAQTNALVKRETLDQMLTRQKTSDGKETRYGMGWNIGERNGQKEVWHGGAQQGLSTTLYIMPGKRLAVAIMTNMELLDEFELARQIADVVLQ
ncbi:MAG: serine hydrolase domain-containing protein [Pyrinomonadaceae bacterium]